MHRELFGPFPLLKFVLFLVTATTGEKTEQPESQNDWNAEMTIKQERPERWNDQKKRNDGSDTCVIICTGAKKHTAWIGKADRPQFRFSVLFFVRFS